MFRGCTVNTSQALAPGELMTGEIQSHLRRSTG